MSNRQKEYKAITWKKDSDDPGAHENFFALDRDQARDFLHEKYGQEIMISLVDVEAADKPR